MKKSTTMWKIFISTLYLSTFTFGGGYVIVTLMKKKFVDDYHWIEENEMLDLVAIAQSSPGAIAINGAIVIGYKLAGMLGVIVAVMGTVIPPFAIIAVISVCYQIFHDNEIVSRVLEGMQAGVGAVIASVTYDMGAPFVKEKDIMSIIIMAAAFAASCIFRVNLYCGFVRFIRRDQDLYGEEGGEEMIYLQLFFSFLQVGMFSFGGGYAAMPLIQGQVVEQHHWLSMSEFTDLITISQMTPGPIAVNSATFVGIRVAGILGAVVATFGCILPSCVIVTILAKLYLKYRSMDMLQGVLHSLRPAVVAMIAGAGISIVITAFWGAANMIRLADTNWRMVIIFMVCVILLRKWKMNPVWVMFLAGFFNLILMFH